MAKTPEYEIEPLVSALRQVVKSSSGSGLHVEGQTDRCCYYGKVAGIGGLFDRLLSTAYITTVNRPHDAGSMLSLLKRAAVELHRDFGVCVTINGSRITVSCDTPTRGSSFELEEIDF